MKFYLDCDPYLLKVAISYCSLICEKIGQEAIRILVQNGTTEQIENVQYKFSGNVELS